MRYCQTRFDGPHDWVDGLCSKCPAVRCVANNRFGKRCGNEAQIDDKCVAHTKGINENLRGKFLAQYTPA